MYVQSKLFLKLPVLGDQPLVRDYSSYEGRVFSICTAVSVSATSKNVLSLGHNHHASQQY